MIHIRAGNTPETIPYGCVAVVDVLLPELATAVERFSGVVAEHGSRASHFASVAREFGLPVLIAVENPFDLLPEGTEVTVDADTGTIYPGRIESLIEATAITRKRRNPAMVRLNKALSTITKLSLTDADDPNFALPNCRSLHDLVRFCHEKGVAQMFSLVGKGAED